MKDYKVGQMVNCNDIHKAEVLEVNVPYQEFRHKGCGCGPISSELNNNHTNNILVRILETTELCKGMIGGTETILTGVLDTYNTIKSEGETK